MNILISIGALLFTTFEVYYLTNWLRKKKERYKTKTIDSTDITPLGHIIALILIGLMTTIFFFLKFLDE